MRTTHQTDRQLHGSSWPRPFRLLASLVFCACALAAWAQSPRVVLTPTAGFTITWDGNNGGFRNPDPGAGPSNNVALASNGTVPGALMLAPTPSEDETGRGLRLRVVTPGAKSLLAVPLRHKQRTYGALVIGRNWWGVD